VKGNWHPVPSGAQRHPDVSIAGWAPAARASARHSRAQPAQSQQPAVPTPRRAPSQGWLRTDVCRCGSKHAGQTADDGVLPPRPWEQPRSRRSAPEWKRLWRRLDRICTTSRRDLPDQAEARASLHRDRAAACTGSVEARVFLLLGGTVFVESVGWRFRSSLGLLHEVTLYIRSLSASVLSSCFTQEWAGACRLSCSTPIFIRRDNEVVSLYAADKCTRLCQATATGAKRCRPESCHVSRRPAELC
jgi:hypothetical protein